VRFDGGRKVKGKRFHVRQFKKSKQSGRRLSTSMGELGKTSAEEEEKSWLKEERKGEHEGKKLIVLLGTFSSKYQLEWKKWGEEKVVGIPWRAGYLIQEGKL